MLNVVKRESMLNEECIRYECLFCGAAKGQPCVTRIMTGSNKTEKGVIVRYFHRVRKSEVLRREIVDQVQDRLTNWYSVGLGCCQYPRKQRTR
jgi:hypothetical protein